jgi:hypothetical protein
LSKDIIVVKGKMFVNGWTDKTTEDMHMNTKRKPTAG